VHQRWFDGGIIAQHIAQLLVQTDPASDGQYLGLSGDADFLQSDVRPL
jgi:hypothetical protein